MKNKIKVIIFSLILVFLFYNIFWKYNNLLPKIKNIETFKDIEYEDDFTVKVDSKYNFENLELKRKFINDSTDLNIKPLYEEDYIDGINIFINNNLMNTILFKYYGKEETKFIVLNNLVYFNFSNFDSNKYVVELVDFKDIENKSNKFILDIKTQKKYFYHEDLYTIYNKKLDVRVPKNRNNMVFYEIDVDDNKEDILKIPDLKDSKLKSYKENVGVMKDKINFYMVYLNGLIKKPRICVFHNSLDIVKEVSL